MLVSNFNASANYTVGHTRSKSGSIVPASAPHRRSLALLPTPAHQVIDGRTVFTWNDKDTEAVGWIVIDNPFPIIAGGGLFMHSKASLQEVTDVATTMSYKLTVGSQPQVVGAKGGIRYNHRAPDAPDVLERFIRDNAAVINQWWGTGGDLNTSHAAIDRHILRYAGVECALAPIARHLGSPVGNQEILHVLKALVPMFGSHVSLEEASVGYGAAIAFRKLIMASAEHKLGTCRVVLQGLGTVGATFAHYIKELGLGTVVGISSQFGFLVDQNGIDVDAICKQRNAALELDPSIDSKLLESGLTADQLANSAHYFPRRTGWSDEQHLCDFLRHSQADAFAPCAGRYVLSHQVLQTLSAYTYAGVPHGERFVIAGANNVFHPSQGEAAWLAALDVAGVSMLPEWISNSGTASVFMRACAGAFTLSRPEALLRACGEDCAAFLSRVYSPGDHAPVPRGSAALFAACYAVAREMRSRGPMNRLGVEHIAHIDCVTTAAARAEETFAQIFGSVPITVPASVEGQEGVRYLRLPGEDDPTLSITDAGKDTTPADTGMSVFFAVTSLKRSRVVLEREGIPFATAQVGVLGDVLQLDGEIGGYNMGFVEAAAHQSAVRPRSESRNSVSHDVDVKKLDHYKVIVPDAAKTKAFHEQYMGYTHLRNNAALQGEDGLVKHVLALPNDSERVLVITEGMNPTSAPLGNRRPYVHHMALQVSDVSRAFERVRGAGWSTTSDAVSDDVYSGVRRFFLKEEEAGCLLEFVERADGHHNAGTESETPSPVEEELVTPLDEVDLVLPTEQVGLKGGNMASLVEGTVASYVKNV